LTTERTEAFFLLKNLLCVLCDQECTPVVRFLSEQTVEVGELEYRQRRGKVKDAREQ